MYMHQAGRGIALLSRVFSFQGSGRNAADMCFAASWASHFLFLVGWGRVHCIRLRIVLCVHLFLEALMQAVQR